MKILIHGINYSPELTGIGKYTGEMAEWLAAQGHQVRVVTAQPYYPQWCIADGFANCWQIIHDQDVTIYRCPLWVPVRPSGLKRILHLASFALSSLPVMLWQIAWCPDVVLVVEPPLFCAPQAWLVARLSGAKAWLHIQDFEVDAAFELGLLKGTTLKRLVLGLERRLLTGFDRVSTISANMLERLPVKGLLVAKSVLFPNWVDVRALSASQLVAAWNFREILGIASDTVVALYSGNMGNKQGLEILSQVAALLVDQTQIVFVFCGDGAGREALVRDCADLSNVRFLELQPYEKLPALLAMADIHLLPQRSDAADLVMPSKLTGMLASARPVVATVHNNTALAAVVSECGLVVPPEQPQALADAILKLSLDRSLRQTMGNKGLSYAWNHLDRDRVLRNFELSLKTLVGY